MKIAIMTSLDFSNESVKLVLSLSAISTLTLAISLELRISREFKTKKKKCVGHLEAKKNKID